MQSRIEGSWADNSCGDRAPSMCIVQQEAAQPKQSAEPLVSIWCTWRPDSSKLSTRETEGDIVVRRSTDWKPAKSGGGHWWRPLDSASISIPCPIVVNGPVSSPAARCETDEPPVQWSLPPRLA